MGQEILRMRRDEIKRLQVIEKVIKRELKQIEAAKVLGLSDRQLRRLIVRVKLKGESGVMHRLRGRVSHRRISDKIREKIVRLYQQNYEGFGPTLASEKLCERDGLKISKETLRQWLIGESLWQVKGVKGKRHLQWRERKGHSGEMIQMDGSHHNWLENRGSWLVLMGFIDDATNKFFGRFYEYEGTIPAMDGLKRYIDKHGIPTCIYLDRHSTYKSHSKQTIEDELEGEKAKSQFEKSCEELGIELIHANSPQAKGRIERLFKTLQDRLVKELRLANAKDLEEANKVLKQFLIKFNQQFNIPARDSGDMHRPVPAQADLREILSVRILKILRNDNTIAHQKRWYQVLSPTRAKQVILQQMLDGRMNILGNGYRLRFKEIAQPPKWVYHPKVRLATRRFTPVPKHPWRVYGQKLSV